VKKAWAPKQPPPWGVGQGEITVDGTLDDPGYGPWRATWPQTTGGRDRSSAEAAFGYVDGSLHVGLRGLGETSFQLLLDTEGLSQRWMLLTVEGDEVQVAWCGWPTSRFGDDGGSGPAAAPCDDVEHPVRLVRAADSLELALEPIAGRWTTSTKVLFTAGEPLASWHGRVTRSLPTRTVRLMPWPQGIEMKMWPMAEGEWDLQLFGANGWRWEALTGRELVAEGTLDPKAQLKFERRGTHVVGVIAWDPTAEGLAPSFIVRRRSVPDRIALVSPVADQRIRFTTVGARIRTVVFSVYAEEPIEDIPVEVVSERGLVELAYKAEWPDAVCIQAEEHVFTVVRAGRPGRVDCSEHASAP